jgi:ferric-dicitrate binding protein FerR (iron transport regulator)
MRINNKSLTRYFLGKSSDKENAAIREWSESSPENWNTFVRERALFDAEILLGGHQQKSSRHIHKFYRVLAFTASAAAILLIIFLAWDNHSLRQQGQQYQSIAVPKGNRTNITLPDGTSVWLSSDTKLFYPSSFTGPEREITLDGEGYFQVIKSKKPFIVRTSKYNIEVLGTTFDVDAYSSSDRFVTTLYEGKVKIYKSDDEQFLFLRPGQTAESRNDSLVVTSTSNAESYKWKDGIIYLGDKSFSEIMDVFEKFFGVRIIIENDGVKSLRYDGKLRISDGIEHALKVLQKDFHFEYEINDDDGTIVIK